MATITAPAPPSEVAGPSPAPARPTVAARVGGWLVRPLVSSLVLLVLYAGCSLLNDPRGYLGTDTGSKVATLRAMDARGDLDPDLGYWASDLDPEGTVHPITFTGRVGDRWVNVSTLPMLYAAVPLYEVGGLRGILLLPMLGGVFCALAARALARRLTRGNPDRVGMFAFWTVGLATPVLVYALDFWEHTLGLAAILWGVVLLLDVAEGRSGWRIALAGGACFGFAATMRTEAVVYAAVTVLVVAVVLVRRRRRGIPGVATAAAIGFLTPLALNQLLERLTLGQALRSGRASSAAGAGGTDLVARVENALRTTVGLNNYAPKVDWLFGALIVVLVGVAAAVLLDPNRRRAVAYVALAFAGALLLFRLSDGLSFLPGMLVTSPFAVAGVIAATRDAKLRPVAAIAIGALPLVFLFQYPDGANAQWGGRYLLASGALLGVVGIVALLGRGTRPFVAFGIAAVLVTGCGVAWLSERSHVVADSAAVLASRDPVMTIGLPHQLREWGAFYDPAAPRLTMDEPGDRGSALGILDATRATHFTVVARTARQVPEHLGDYERVSTRSIEFLSGIRFTVAEYTRT